MMPSMVVACRTLLAFVAVARSSCVAGWTHRPPPSVFPSHQQLRPLRNFLPPLEPSQLRRRRLVCIRGGEDDFDDVQTENIVPSSQAVLEKERSSDCLQGPPLSMSMPLELPPKIPRVEFPDRPTPLYEESTAIQQRPTTTRSTISGTVLAHPHRKVLILMDSFCDVHGQFLAERARDVYGVTTLQVYSDYMRGYFLHLQPDDRPENIQESLSMCMPSSLEEVKEWCSRLDDEFCLLGGATSVEKGYELVALVCDSDSGLAHAEQLADWLNVTTRNPGGVQEKRRNKYLMIETIRSAGIPTIEQRLCSSQEEAVEFATSLLLATTSLSPSSSSVQSRDDSDDVDDVVDRQSIPQSGLGSTTSCFRQNHVVIKPVRGCGSHNVYLCDDLDSVTCAFDRIYGSGIFGSPGQKHESVLVQEFAIGEEFAIDTVSRDGELKIVAIWKYDKRPANGAPFVYYATKLFDDNNKDSGKEPIIPALYAYLSSCLEALDIRWGITHSEVIVTPDGPRLVEVNCRQHNMDFLLLTMGGVGYNIYDVLLAAYFGHSSNDGTTDNMPVKSDKNRLEWNLIPDIPTTRMNAAMVHLVNSKNGTLKRVNDEALYEIEAMASVVDLEVYSKFLEVGTQICPTVDIKSDAGWIQLIHPEPEIFATDFQRIIELMPTLFEVEEATNPGSDK